MEKFSGFGQDGTGIFGNFAPPIFTIPQFLPANPIVFLGPTGMLFYPSQKAVGSGLGRGGVDSGLPHNGQPFTASFIYSGLSNAVEKTTQEGLFNDSLGKAWCGLCRSKIYSMISISFVKFYGKFMKFELKNSMLF